MPSAARTVSISGATGPGNYDWNGLVADLNRLLRLRTTPIGMKLFATKAEMEAIPKIRRPKSIHTMDQIVGMASRIGWTVGVTNDDFVGAQCGAVVGLSPRDEEWLSGSRMAGRLVRRPIEDAAAHQHAMHTVPFGQYEALAVSPLTAGRLDPPDICLIYATPAQMILMINGLQWSGYKNFEWGCVGESACADSWGRALKLREPSRVHPLLRRASLRWGAGRRAAAGHAAGVPAEDDRRAGSAVPATACATHPALRHPERRPGRPGLQLQRVAPG